MKIYLFAGEIILERILDYRIEKQEEGSTIYDYLRSKGYSSQNIIELKKMSHSILVDNDWKHVNYILSYEQHLRIHIRETGSNEHILPVPLPFPVLYEDDDLVIINKPMDMPTHPSQNNHTNTLANAAAYYYEIQNKTPFTFRCINRLDKDTTGLTILAKNMYSANLLAQKIQRKEITRFYLAFVKGSFPSAYGTIRLPISRKEGSSIERIVDHDKGTPAITHYYKLKDYQDYTLLALRLETGRTHQIRVHLSHLGYPLLGDSLYNPSPDAHLISRQALHAGRIILNHPLREKRIKITAPLPEDMRSLCDL